MCGIIAYLGTRPAKEVLLAGLAKLEYRGYDSAGLCFSDKNGLLSFKAVGPVKNLVKTIEGNDKYSLGIAHTRWATHGEPSEINAHPHFDCQHKIAIVHNGIIENHNALKEMLIKEGHKFVSATDSEVIAHLIEKFDEGNLESAFIKAINLLQGSFAVVAIQAGSRRLLATRRSSPLIIGVGKEEFFIASDVPAVLAYTNQVIYLQDNDFVSIDDSGYKIKTLAGKEIKRELEGVQMNLEEIEKGGFKHFMLKEIMEQPITLAQTIAGRVVNDKIKISLQIIPGSFDRIVMAACGTSWHSALIGKYLIEEIAGVRVEVDYASEFRYRQPLISSRDIFLAISQSGETADTLAALREAKAGGAQTAALVNIVGSTLAREVDSGIYLHAGPEIGVASTKAFSSQIAGLLIFALYLRQLSGASLDKGLLMELKNLPKAVEAVLAGADKIASLAQQFKKTNNFLFLGRGLNFPVALEGALKLKEISYIHAEGYPAAEIKHGPIALIDEDMPVLFIATKNLLSDKILSNMAEVKARQGKIIAVVDRDFQDIAALADHLLVVPSVHPLLAPIINNIPLQLLAYYIADARGLDVDRPRNLAKSVTVE
jgi:glucosamine--fructose-6-phosphate aminotransferase (isomerizing)